MIHDFNNISNGRDPFRQKSYIDESNKVHSPQVDKTATDQEHPDARMYDRVEISAEARASNADLEREQAIAFAKKALLSVPPLDQEAIGEYQQRIQDGYYQSPAVHNAVAGNIADQI